MTGNCITSRKQKPAKYLFCAKLSSQYEPTSATRTISVTRLKWVKNTLINGQGNAKRSKNKNSPNFFLRIL